MANPRTPAAVAKATGADVKNPQRFRARSEPKVAPLGAPPKRLGEDEMKAWRELSEEMPWLARSDRKLVEIAARLTARMMRDPDMGVNALAQLRMCLTEMGGGPSSRSKVAAPDDDEDDPLDEFIN